MKLLLGISADGFLARGPVDDMSWTGKTDKAIFRLLTLVGDDRPLLAGRVTYDQLPPLKGRMVYPLSRDRAKGFHLEECAHRFPGAWLIGGPTVAQEALAKHLVTKVILCRSKAALGQGIASPIVNSIAAMSPAQVISIGDDLTVLIYNYQRLSKQWPGK